MANNRQLAAQETRYKLIVAADKIISEKGLANTSINEITDAAGVSKGTFYTYFKRKEDIVHELSRDRHEEIIEAALQTSGDFSTRLCFFMTQLASYIEDGSVKLCQEWIRNTVNPTLIENPLDKKIMDKDVANVKRLFEQGMMRNELTAETPVDILSHTIIDICYGQMLCWAMADGVYGFTERTKEFCDYFINNLLTPYLN